MVESVKYMKVSYFLQVFFLFILTVCIAGYFSFLGINPHHHGIMLKPAFDMNHGQMLFKDTFNQYGALTTILQALAMRVFGNYLIVINLLTAFFYGLVVVLLWLTWSLFLPAFFSTTACLVWLFLAPYFLPDYIFLPWSSVYSLCFQLATLYTLLLFLKSKKIVWLPIAGVTAALTFWAREPVGVFMVGSIILFLIVSKIKKYKAFPIFPFFLTYFCIHGVFLIWLIINNALGAWWYQTIRFPFLWAQSSSQLRIPFIQIIMNLVANPIPSSNTLFSLWVVVPLVIVYLGYTLLTSPRREVKQSMLMLSVLICLASWLQYHPVSDIRHLYWGATPMIGYVFYTVWIHTGAKKKYFVFLLICIALFVPDLFYRIHLGYRKIKETYSYVSLTVPDILKYMRVPKGEKIEYEFVVKKIVEFEKKYPKTFITTTAPDALYSMFDGKSINCSPFTVNWAWDKYDSALGKKYNKQMIDCINTYKPLIFSKTLYYLPTYQPPGYVQVTKGEGEINYLLVPKE